MSIGIIFLNFCFNGIAKKHRSFAAMPFLFAEGEGFEPPSPCGLTVFKTAAIDHSANLPFIGMQR